MTPSELKSILGPEIYNRFELNCTKPITAILSTQKDKHQLIIDSFEWYKSNEAIENGSSSYGFKFWSDVNEIYLEKILKNDRGIS